MNDARPPPADLRPPPPDHRPPPAGMVVARWTYVDEARTHEVHAGIRPGARPQFVVKESAYQNDDPDAIVETTQAIESPWEPQLYQWQLECRLALVGGRYWRHDAQDPGWRPLTPPQGLPQVDAREVAVSPYRGRVSFYHFFHRGTRADRMLVVVPQPEQDRFLVASVALDFPSGEDSAIVLLHRALSQTPTRSLLMREHLALKGEGYEKLVWAPDFAQAHGLDWARETGQAYEQVLRRISEGRFGSPKDARAAVALDPLYTDFLGALTDPRLLELQARYLTPEEQASALAGGGPAIRRLIASKRADVPHDEQHKLTVVEASLLARDQLRPGHRVDPEVSALVRRFSFYL